MPKPKIQISWSGGKDSALALQRIINSQQYEIDGLHTVFDAKTKKVGIHNVSEELIEEQARLLKLPVTKLYLTKKPLAYEKLMKKYYQMLCSEGIHHVMFGDIFLEDLRDFREQLLRPTQTQGVYPLWQENTNALLNEFLDAGFKSRLCAVDSKYFEPKDVGEYLTKKLVQAHPEIDACGENGEYHSLVVNGPFFSKPLCLKNKSKYEEDFVFDVTDEKGNQKIIKDRFYFIDFELSSNN